MRGRAQRARAPSTSTSSSTATRCAARTRLTLPHPRLHERRFVLVPLAEVAPDLRHPVLRPHRRASCWRACPDHSRVERWPRPRAGALMTAHYIAIEGPIGVGKSSVVERLAERLEARTVMEEWGQNPFLTPFYEGTAGRRLPDRALLPPLALPAAAGAHPAHALPALHALRLRLREEQALRLPEPRRLRAAHLREALRAARGGRAAARPRGLPAGAHRGAAAAHPHARPARRRRA